MHNDIIHLDKEKKELLNKFILRIKEINVSIDALMDDVKTYKQTLTDDMLNLSQKLDIDKKILKQFVKAISEPQKVQEEQEIYGIVENLLENLKKS